MFCEFTKDECATFYFMDKKQLLLGTIGSNLSQGSERRCGGLVANERAQFFDRRRRKLRGELQVDAIPLFHLCEQRTSHQYRLPCLLAKEPPAKWRGDIFKPRKRSSVIFSDNRYERPTPNPRIFLIFSLETQSKRALMSAFPTCTDNINDSH